MRPLALLTALALLSGCSRSEDRNGTQADTPNAVADADTDAGATPTNYADVVEVRVTGDDTPRFAVTVRSPDRGCDQYANWWEVVTPEGELLYRRILHHSHVDEQPFTRSGGPVPISPDQPVIVRAHMHPGGYGGRAMRGSVKTGFQPHDAGAEFAPELASGEPQPQDCRF